jgi:integrase
MRQLMPQPWKHPKTGVYYFRKVVPERLRGAVGRREIKLSLRTKVLREAKLRYPEAAARADQVLQRASGEEVRLTHKQILALAGEWYRRELAAREEEPGHPDDLALEAEILIDKCEGSLTPEYREYLWNQSQKVGGAEPGQKYLSTEFLQDVQDDVRNLLLNEGIVANRNTLNDLAEQIYHYKILLLRTLGRTARGDYSADEVTTKLPHWERQPADQDVEAEGKTLQTLLNAWATERRPPERTRYEWRRVVDRLAQHLGHHDAERITKADIVGWKDALLASGKGPKTVKNHVDIIHALYNSALSNERLRRTDNPAHGVKVAQRPDPGKRRLPFDEADARLILEAARREQGAKRWIPWLLAFTGARLDEICQARRADARQEAGIWFPDINAEQGKKLKNVGSARRIPLHRAIFEEGFREYLGSLPRESMLLPELKPDRFGSPGGKATKMLGRWIRGLGITDPRKAPSHSWRHRFKDACRRAGIEKAVHDALTGHATSGVGDQYGLGYPLETLAEAVEKLPVPKLAREPSKARTRREATEAQTCSGGQPMDPRIPQADNGRT